ncbi:MAG: PhzF family phenazine biosynthesis protein, partial [Chlamydiales bacterium]|nr:PhzF family phenazine biosynthesis protein [Chlamydiales bacterium]
MWCIWKKFVLSLILIFWGAIIPQGATYRMPSEQNEWNSDVECTVYIARAFCRDNLGGNLAGVVLEQKFTTEQMQAIAKKLGFSETVFLLKIGPSLYKALYFTPNSSIDFCGHATIAAFGELKEIDNLKNAIYQVETH